MVSLSCKALLTLALSMLAARSNAAPYVYTTSATTSSADWVTEDLPLSDLIYFFFPTGTGDQDVVYYNPPGYDTYASSTSTSSSIFTSSTLTSSSSSSSSTSSIITGFTSSAPLSSTSSYTVPTYFPASSYSNQASVVSSILSGESPSMISNISSVLHSALGNPHVYFTTSADASTFTTQSEGSQLTYTETYHHLLGLEPGYVSVAASAANTTTTIFEPPVVHTVTKKASTRTINEGTHTHTVYEKPVTRTVTEAPVVHTVDEKPVVKTVVHVVYRTEKPHIRYITRRVHRHHHDHHGHDQDQDQGHETESTDSVSRTTSTLAPSAASN